MAHQDGNPGGTTVPEEHNKELICVFYQHSCGYISLDGKLLTIIILYQNNIISKYYEFLALHRNGNIHREFALVAVNKSRYEFSFVSISTEVNENLKKRFVCKNRLLWRDTIIM